MANQSESKIFDIWINLHAMVNLRFSLEATKFETILGTFVILRKDLGVLGGSENGYFLLL